MKKLILAVAVMVVGAAFAGAQETDYVNEARDVIKSSIPIITVNVSSFAMTNVDSTQLAGSFVVEIENRDSTNDICCAFNASASTVTANNGNGCRVVSHGYGTWAVKRWWKNILVYCQSFSTSGTSTVALTQGR